MRPTYSPGQTRAAAAPPECIYCLGLPVGVRSTMRESLEHALSTHCDDLTLVVGAVQSDDDAACTTEFFMPPTVPSPEPEFAAVCRNLDGSFQAFVGHLACSYDSVAQAESEAQRLSIELATELRVFRFAMRRGTLQ